MQLWRHLLGRIERHVPDADVKLMNRELRPAEQLESFALADVFDAIDRFYRTGTSRARESGGTGRGLAIVRSIVEADRGTVAVGS